MSIHQCPAWMRGCARWQGTYPLDALVRYQIDWFNSLCFLFLVIGKNAPSSDARSP